VKLYEITLEIRSGMGTPLKGDTLFGHFCWQAAYDASLVEGGLEKQLKRYVTQPFAVFSSAIAKLGSAPAIYALKRPEMPLSHLYELGHTKAQRIQTAKEVKKEKWLLHSGWQTIALDQAVYHTDKAICQKAGQRIDLYGKKAPELTDVDEFIKTAVQPHNTINRLTFSTGTGQFAPYAKENSYYHPYSKLAVLVLLDENATDIDCIVTGLKCIGRWGFGRDASIGMGRFKVERYTPIPLPDTEQAEACYTLAPCIPDTDCFQKSWFKPFVRFGKHGDQLVHAGNPFKNPVIMADEGAVFVPESKQIFNKPYLGQAVTEGISLSMPRTVVQGYTPYLPVTWSKHDETEKL